MPAAEYEKWTATTSSGTWAGNNTVAKNGFLRGVRVRPTTASTVYDLRFVDGDGFEVYHRRGIQGEYIENLAPSVCLRSLMDMNIENATADEDFVVVLYWDPK